MLKSLAFVLPRYGRSLGGGAETLSKAIVDELRRRNLVEHLEVWTTCALDHRTWENELPPGEALVDGITVHRFPVSPRDTDIFIHAEINIREGRPLLVHEQLDWLANSVNSQALYEHIAREGQGFEALIFAPYLFATSFWGPLIYPDRSYLIPCLHNEAYAYQPVFRHVFSKVAGLIFNTEAERELAEEIYALPGIRAKSQVVGMGFEPTSVCDAQTDEPFILYSGRKEEGKNLHLLIDYFDRFRTSTSTQVRLKIIGAGEIHFREGLPDGVEDLGFVSEAEKLELMAKASVLCQPSVNESFSIVMMEAWQQELPLLVHAQCSVTRSHVSEANGGLYFSNYPEFAAALAMLIEDSSLQRQLGKNGRAYVEEQYSWDAVLERFMRLFGRSSEVTAINESR